MYVTRITDRPIASIPGVTHRTLAGGADGLRHLSVWQQSVAARAATPPHRHDCEEVVIVTAGCGELHIDAQVLPFAAGSVLVIPAGVDHQIINVGDDDLDLLATLSSSPVEVLLPSGEPLPLPWPT